MEKGFRTNVHKKVSLQIKIKFSLKTLLFGFEIPPSYNMGAAPHLIKINYEKKLLLTNFYFLMILKVPTELVPINRAK